MELLSLNPLSVNVAITGGEALYMKEGVPHCKVDLDFSWGGTIEELVSEIIFINAESWLPSVGGICVKNKILFRSAQTAPPALYNNNDILYFF